MTVSILFKIAAVGILITVLNQVLKHSGREDQAFLCSLAGLVLVLMWLIPYIYDLFCQDAGAVFDWIKEENNERNENRNDRCAWGASCLAV